MANLDLSGLQMNGAWTSGAEGPLKPSLFWREGVVEVYGCMCPTSRTLAYLAKYGDDRPTDPGFMFLRNNWALVHQEKLVGIFDGLANPKRAFDVADAIIRSWRPDWRT